MEDLKGQIGSVKASDLSVGFQTPLQEFWGTLEDFSAERDERFDRVRVTLYFVDVEVIRSTESYPFPIAQIIIPFSQARRSQMGFLIQSIEEHIPGGSISSLVGRRMRMNLEPKNYGRWRGEEEDRVRDTWVVAEILPKPEEVEAVDAYTLALEKVKGYTVDNLQEYYQEVLKDPRIKENRDVVSTIITGNFIKDALDKGLLKVDEQGRIY